MVFSTSLFRNANTDALILALLEEIILSTFSPFSIDSWISDNNFLLFDKILLKKRKDLPIVLPVESCFVLNCRRESSLAIAVSISVLRYGMNIWSTIDCPLSSNIFSE